jgi:hypothetical protein
MLSRLGCTRDRLKMVIGSLRRLSRAIKASTQTEAIWTLSRAVPAVPCARALR